MIAIKMSWEHTERKVVAHAKIDSAETPKLLNSSKNSGHRLLQGFRFLGLLHTVWGRNANTKQSCSAIKNLLRKLDYTFHAGEKNSNNIVVPTITKQGSPFIVGGGLAAAGIPALRVCSLANQAFGGNHRIQYFRRGDDWQVLDALSGFRFYAGQAWAAQ
jgi:hypothetical protein